MPSLDQTSRLGMHTWACLTSSRWFGVTPCNIAPAKFATYSAYDLLIYYNFTSALRFLQFLHENYEQVRQRISATPGSAVKTRAEHIAPPPSKSKATFPSVTACRYLLDSRDREWCLQQAVKHNFSLLWPWPLTPWPPRSIVYALAPGKIYANLHWKLKSAHSFSK